MKAINAMARVYGTSSITLVLDSTLKTIEADTSSEAKVLVRLRANLWNHRIWTLQEASLSQDLAFVFKDGITRAWDLWRRTYTIPNPIDYGCRIRLEQLL